MVSHGPGSPQPHTARRGTQLSAAALALSRRPRTVTTMARDGWVLTHSSRYCPQCLAGDGTEIQQAHGGALQSTWRLAITFACLRHNRLLESRCPDCGELAQSNGQLTNSTRWLPGRLVPNPHTTLHPAQCRAVQAELRGEHHRRQHPCGTRLDNSSLPVIRPDPQFVGLQQRLLVLRRDTAATTISMGAPATMVDYVTDLRTLIMLIVATWPAARSLAPGFAHLSKIESYLDQRQRLFAEGARFSAPLPTDVGTCASLLLPTRPASIPPPGSTALLLARIPLRDRSHAGHPIPQPRPNAGFPSRNPPEWAIQTAARSPVAARRLAR
ncbi:TniQ family protein [Streptomyces sp. HUAS TT7]|uniref:TniQ family protein n=1 Tax=Streptomyces sp. HUAS TT7 TaxID=3447507 RepID=UPI003F659EF1